MIVTEMGSLWVVRSELKGPIVAGPFRSNSEAWRAYDRLAGEPVSKREETAEWIANKG